MLHCDWCGKPIDSKHFATLEPGGRYNNGSRIAAGARTYHSSYEYETLGVGDLGVSDRSCFGRALLHLDGSEFKTPDAGMRWQLVPSIERGDYQNNYAQALGSTPLAELGLTDAMYSSVTKCGIFTVEHLVDARLRSVEVCRPKTLAKLDAILIERGLLEPDTQREVAS